MSVFIASLFLPLTLDKHNTGVEKSPHGNIGLQNAIRSANLEKKPVWIGCVGPNFDPAHSSIAKEILKEHACIPVFPTLEEFNGSYRDFCKQVLCRYLSGKVLWKPFHYQLQGYPKSVLFEERAWKHYLSVNLKFAQKIVESYARVH